MRIRSFNWNINLCVLEFLLFGPHSLTPRIYLCGSLPWPNTEIGFEMLSWVNRGVNPLRQGTAADPTAIGQGICTEGISRALSMAGINDG